jgi:Carboxypeptidase regulatory-like domain
MRHVCILLITLMLNLCVFATQYSGVVVNTSGETVAGATVTASATFPNHATTDAAGTFVLDVTRPGDVRLWASHAGFAPGFSQLNPKGKVTIQLNQEAVYKGQVVANITGKPIQGAHMGAMISQERTYFHEKAITSSYIFPPKAKSNADGNFTISGFYPGEKYTLGVSAKGFAPTNIELDPKNSEPVKIFINREAAIAGHVLLASDSSPVPGAYISYYEKRPVTSDIHAVASATGAYYIGQLEKEDGQAILAWHGNLVPVKKPQNTISTRLGKTTNVPPIKLEPGWTARISVINASTSLPLEGSIVAGKGRLPWLGKNLISNLHFVYLWMRKTENATTSLSPLPRWEIKADVIARNYYKQEITLSPDSATATIKHITVALEPFPTIKGKVITADKAQVEGATVASKLQPLMTPYKTGFQDIYNKTATTSTDATGSFEIMVDKRKRITLTASMAGYATSTKSGISAGDEEVIITLKKGGSLLGKVRFENGDIPRSATVVCKNTNSYEVKIAHTDERGIYSFLHLSKGKYELQGFCPGFTSQPSDKLRVVDKDKTIANDIVLIPGYGFGGMIVNKDTGDPIDGITINLSGKGYDMEPHTTGTDGVFSLETIPPGEYRIDLGFADDESDSIYILPSRREASRINIVDRNITDYIIELVGGARITGIVLNDEDDSPIKGARVNLTGDGMGALMRLGRGGTKRTDEEGRFSLTTSLHDSGLKVGVNAKGFSSFESEPIALREGEVTKDIEVRMLRGRSIQGIVMDEDDQPAPGVWVIGKYSGNIMEISAKMAQSGDDMVQKTDDEGRFSIDNLPPDNYEILAARDKNPMAIMFSKDTTKVKLTGREDVTDVVLHIKKEPEMNGYLRGIVVDSEGEPLSGITIVANGIQPGMMDFENMRYMQGNAITVRSGTFEIKKLKEGKYTVMVFQGRQQRVSYSNVEVPQDNYKIQLEANGGIAGKVVDPEGQPVTQFRATANSTENTGMPFNPSKKKEGQFYSSKDGSFELTELNPGSYRIEVSSEHFAPRTSETIEVEGGKVTEGIVIHLSGGGAVQLHIVSKKDKSPIEGVSVQTGSGDMMAAISNIWGGGERVRPSGPSTDDQGYCTLKHLAAGNITITLTHEKCAPAQVEAEIEIGKTTEIEVVLSQGGMIDGYVKNTEGVGLAGETINIMPANPSMTAADGGGMEKTDANGYYSCKNLPPGTYSVLRNMMSILGGDKPMQTKSAIVEEGMITEVNFGEKGARIYGVVTRDGAPVPDARVMLSGGLENAAMFSSTNTDENGSYEFTGLAPGNVEIMLTGTGMNMTPLRTVKVELTTEEQREVNLVFPQGIIRGLVRSGGTREAISGAEVFYGRESDSQIGMAAFRQSSKTDEEGRFEITGVAGGAIILTAKANGYGQAKVNIELEEDSVIDGAIIELPKGGSLKGNISFEEGAASAINMAFIRMYNLDGTAALPGMNMTQAGPDMTYSIEGLSQGPCIAMAFGLNTEPIVKQVEITVGETSQCDFLMRAGIKATIELVDPQNKWVEKARIEVRVNGLILPLRECGMIIASENQYACTLGRQNYELIIQAEGYQTITRGINLVGYEGKSYREKITMPPLSQ